MVSIMLPRLQVPNNFKFKFFFGGQIPKEIFTPNEFFSFDVLESNHMGEQRNQHQNPKLTTIAPNNSPKVFECFKNPNPIVVEDVHAFKFKRKKNF
jgi:hypothetical protein